MATLNLPEENDAFWHLLLHYMLDRGEVPLPWREIVHEGPKSPHVAGPLDELHRRLTRRGDQRQVTHGEHEPVTGRRCTRSSSLFVKRGWHRWTPPVVFASPLTVRCRASGLSQWTSFRPGLSVAVLGPDGAGKTTLANGLRDSLAIPTDYVYMGLWKDDRLQQLLSHIPGSNLFLLLVRLAARSCRLNYYRWRGHIVILDRFSYDAVWSPRKPPGASG